MFLDLIYRKSTEKHYQFLYEIYAKAFHDYLIRKNLEDKYFCLLFFLLDLCSEKNVTHDDHFFLFPPTHVGEKAKIECMGKFGVKKNASYECVKNGTYYAQWTNFNDSECFFHDNSKSSLEELSKVSVKFNRRSISSFVQHLLVFKFDSLVIGEARGTCVFAHKGFMRVWISVFNTQ